MAILALFIALTAAAYFSGQQVKRSSDLITTDAVPGTVNAHKMRMAISRSIGWAMVAASAQTTQSRDQSLKTAHEADTAFADTVREYQTTIKIDPAKDRALLDQVTGRYEEYHRKRMTYEALILAGDRDGAAAFLERDLVPAYAVATRVAEDLLDYNHGNNFTYAGFIRDSVHRLYWTVAVVIVLALICAAVLFVNFSIRREEVRKLRESEELFRASFESATVGVCLVATDGRFINVNRTLCDMLGYSREELLQLTFNDVTHEEDKEIGRTFLANALSGGPKTMQTEKRYLHKDGRVVWAFLSTALIEQSREHGGYMISYIQDITERKQAATALLALQRHRERTLSALGEGLQVIDRNGIIIYENPAAAAMLGWNTHEIIGRNGHQLMHHTRADGSPYPREECKILATLRDGVARRVEDEVFWRKDGTSFSAAYICTAMRDDTGEINEVVVAFRDITEQKKADEHIRRLNRTYLVLSGVNQTIVREKSTQNMMEEICRICVELGKFRMVWIGLFDEATRKIQPVASGGVLEGYLDLLNLDMDDKTRTTGPAGRSFLSGQRVVCDNIEHDPGMLPWRDEALKRGYRSAACFPLKIRGRTTGVINLYADEPGFFDEEELRLLDELAGDTGFAMEVGQLENERREAGLSLEQSEERFSRIFQSSPIPTTLRTLSDGKFLDANESFLRMSDFTRKEVIGHTPLELSLYFDPEKYAYIMEQLREHGHLYAHEQLFRTKSGEIRNHFLWFDVITISGQQCVLVFALDITERIRAEETLREKQAQLLHAMDIAKLAHWEFDVATNLFTGEEHIFQLLGTTSEKEGGLSMSPDIYIRKFVHPDDAQTVASELVTAVTTTDPHFSRQFEHRIIRADKTEGVMITRSRVVMDAAGRTAKIYGANQDITESRKLEAQFRQAQKMEAVGQLASGVAHDFNNILAVISMQAGFLVEDENLTPMQSELLREMEGAVQRAADLTRQLLMFSRRQTMQPRDLDLNTVIINISKMLKRILREDVECHFNCALQPLYVNIDAGMMDQVLMNLTVNARDAMPDGGKIVIETSGVELDEAAASQLPQARPGSFACLSVSDTGCGIPPENMQRIFEPFFTTKDVGKGTGLGLATVFGIVQQHQGWLNISSEVGRGTTFRIYLPRIAQGGHGGPGEKRPPSTFAGTETILMVEDDTPLRFTISSALSHLGYTVLEAATGAEGVQIWEQNRKEIQLLLTDLMLPGGMNGKEMARQILKQKPGLKVLYTSGYSSEVAGKDLILEEGINYLSKPFNAHRLAQAIRSKLDS